MKYLLLLILLIAVACSDKPEESADTPVGTSAAIFVKTAAVERTQVSPPILASGMVATSSEARVSFKTGGVIKRTFVEEGAVVAKGQLLATLDLTEIDAQVRQTKEGQAKAKRDLERAQNLHADSIATYEQVQNAGTAVDLATQNVQIAEFNRQFSEIRAPFHGKVVRQLLFEGEVTGPGMPVYYLMGAGSQDWILQVGLSDRDWARLQLGDQAKVTLDAYPGDTLLATVSQLAVVANPQSGTFDAELQLQPKGKRLAAGLVASVMIQPKNGHTYSLIPIEPLVESNGKHAFVYTSDSKGHARRIPVQIGFLFGEKVAVTQGLEGVDAVITAGAPYLREGQAISIR